MLPASELQHLDRTILFANLKESIGFALSQNRDSTKTHFEILADLVDALFL